MAIFAYILFGVHILLLLPLFLRKQSNATMPTVMFFIAGTYFVLAMEAPQLVAPFAVLEFVAFVRFVFKGFFSTAGSSVSRHTLKVFSKSFWASFFTWLMTCGLMGLTFDASMVWATVYAWPVFFAAEYALRRYRAYKVQRYLDRTGQKP